jgi:hypothetical protein
VIEAQYIVPQSGPLAGMERDRARVEILAARLSLCGGLRYRRKLAIF